MLSLAFLMHSIVLQRVVMVFSVSVRNKYRAAYLVDLVDLSSIKNIIFLVILSCLTCLEEIVIFNFFAEKDSVLIIIALPAS